MDNKLANWAYHLAYTTPKYHRLHFLNQWVEEKEPEEDGEGEGEGEGVQRLVEVEKRSQSGMLLINETSSTLSTPNLLFATYLPQLVKRKLQYQPSKLETTNNFS